MLHAGPTKRPRAEFCTAGHHWSPVWSLGATSRLQQDFIKTTLVTVRHKFQPLSLTEEELAGKAETNSEHVCNNLHSQLRKKKTKQLKYLEDTTSSLLFNSTTCIMKLVGYQGRETITLTCFLPREVVQQLCLGQVQIQFNMG